MGHSAEPVRVALQEHYGAQRRWPTVQVGLHERAPPALRGFTTDPLRESYREFWRRFGMPFCMLARPRLHGSWPGARVVTAAEMPSPTAGAALRRLRLAWFLEVRPMDDRDELLALAAGLEGIDGARLATDFAGAMSVHALRTDMALAWRPDRVALALGKATQPPGGHRPRFSIPIYTFEAHGRTATVPGFQPLGTDELTLHNVAPELERRAVALPVVACATGADRDNSAPDPEAPPLRRACRYRAIERGPRERRLAALARR